MHQVYTYNIQLLLQYSIIIVVVYLPYYIRTYIQDLTTHKAKVGQQAEHIVYSQIAAFLLIQHGILIFALLHGILIYYPLYLIKLLINLTNNIVKVIKQVDVLSLTICMLRIYIVYINKTTYYSIGRFILLPQYYILYKKYRTQTLRAVYSSLNIKD